MPTWQAAIRVSAPTNPAQRPEPALPDLKISATVPAGLARLHAEPGLTLLGLTPFQAFSTYENVPLPITQPPPREESLLLSFMP
jgi:hypothetical protein